MGVVVNTHPNRPFPHGSEWMEEAACLDADPDIFDKSVQPDAMRLCIKCPKTSECLDHLLSWPEQVGFGAGMTEDERVREQATRDWERRKLREKAELRKSVVQGPS